MRALLRIFLSLTLIVVSFGVPSTEAHGVYVSNVGNYRIMLIPSPEDPLVDEEVQFLFYVQDLSTGEYLRALKPMVEIEHQTGSMKHVMTIQAKLQQEMFYGFSFSFSHEGLNPISITLENGGKRVKTIFDFHVMPGTERPKQMMPGMPDWLFLAASGGTIALTFLVVGAFGGEKSKEGYRTYDLLRIKFVRSLVKKKYFQSVFQIPSVLIFTLIILAGVLGVEQGFRNFAPVMTWVIWWVLLIFVTLFLGKVFCLVCPIRAVGEWVQRLVTGKVIASLAFQQRKWPRIPRNILIALLLLLFLTWLELGFGITRNPQATAYLAIFMLLLGVGTMLIFRRNYFCRYLCPIGLMTGIYSYVAPVELTAKNREICISCRTKGCLKGSRDGYGCPTYQYLGAMDGNSDCLFCTECARTCDRDNVALNLRPFAAGLVHSCSPRLYLGIAIVALLALATFHGFSMVPMWGELVNYAGWLGHQGAFTVWMIIFTAMVFGIFLSFVALSKITSGKEDMNIRQLFSSHAYSLISIPMFYHMAHNLSHLNMESQLLMPVLSDPFGWGWDILGTANMTPGVLLPMTTIWYIQVLLILVGNVIAVYVGRGVSLRLYGDIQRARRGHVPIVGMMILYSMFNLWITAQPMLMRTSL